MQTQYAYYVKSNNNQLFTRKICNSSVHLPNLTYNLIKEENNNNLCIEIRLQKIISHLILCNVNQICNNLLLCTT
jgi:hypothetical protein